MSLALDVRDLTKIYSGKQRKKALDSFNLQLPEGSFFALLGRNGAGKSTLINILFGTTLKSSGKVSIFGSDIDTQRITCCFKIGVVPQELCVDPFFTVEEALNIHAGYYGISKKRNKTEEIIEALGLSEQRHSRGGTLSGGMKRRLLIGKALVHSPKFLLLDEPTAGVDIDLRLQLWEYIKEINRNGTTILLTTHYLEEAQQLCDRIAIMDKGKVVACDTKENLLNICNIKRMQITIDGNNLHAVLPELNNICKAHIEGDDKLFVEYVHSDSVLHNILHCLYSNHLTVRDIVTDEVSLEEVYRHLVH